MATRKWCWPTTMEYFQQIATIMNGLHRDHNDKIIKSHNHIVCYLRMESARYLFIYLAPLSHNYRLLLFDAGIMLNMTIEINLILSFMFFWLANLYENFFHSKLIYECDPGFIMSGTGRERICQGDGSWSGWPPQCKTRRMYSFFFSCGIFFPILRNFSFFSNNDDLSIILTSQ